MWVLFAVLSAVCLGFYDVSKKRALTDNSVTGVLTVSILVSSVILLTAWGIGVIDVPMVDAKTHGYIFLKSCLVLTSWLCAYGATKHLSLSVVSPMQATRPMWTLAGALLIFGERLNGWQWAGVVCALGSVFLFSFAEVRHKEIRNQLLHEDRRYYILLALAVLTGAASGLYDKYMMRHYDHNAVQVYYTLYQAVLMCIVWAINHKSQIKNHKLNTLSWRWEIVAISVFLVLSDYVYLVALSDPDSLIAVVSTIRRAGTIIPFLYGLIVLREKDPWKKILCLCGILTGLVFLLVGTL